MKEKLYKVLIDNKSCHGGNSEWKLKEWMPRIENCKICEQGYHLTTKPYEWFKWGCDIYEAEGKDEIDRKEDKVLFKSARIIKRLPKPDWLSKAEKFIASLKNFKFGKQDNKVLKEWIYFENKKLSAAWDAAGNAARNAARNAAGDAARNAAWDAAGNAAWNAAGNAARNAARNAAGDAAWNAAGDAAWNAAGNAARNAAWDAAWNAAGDAALYARFLIISDLVNKDENLKRHFIHVKKRWQVYQKGYWLKCDVNGKLYVYGVKK